MRHDDHHPIRPSRSTSCGRRAALASAAAAVLWAGCLGTAHAGGVNWSVGVNLPAAPLYGPGPVIGVQVGSGHGHGYGQGWRGDRWRPAWRGYGPRRGPGWDDGRRGYGGGVGYYGPSVGIVVPVTPWVVERRERVVEVPVRPAMPLLPSRPDPVVYPRNGQSAQQAERDRRQCDRWATTQAAAMAEASVFQRSVEACMDGRGYTLR